MALRLGLESGRATLMSPCSGKVIPTCATIQPIMKTTRTVQARLDP
jgi:hypothetical protein